MAHLAQRLGAHELEVAPDLGDHAAELVEGGRDEALLGARLAVLGEHAPGRPVVLDLVVPLVVVEDPLAEVLLVLLGLDVGHIGQPLLGGRVRAAALGVVRAAVRGARGRVLVALGGGLLGDLVGGALAGLGLAGAHRLVQVLALAGLLAGVGAVGALVLRDLDLARRGGVAGRAHQLLHHRRHEGGKLELLVVLDAPAARGRLLGVAGLGGRSVGGRRGVVGAKRAAGVGQALVDQPVQLAGQGRRVADARRRLLDGAQHPGRLHDQGLGGRREVGRLGRQAERVLQQRLDNRLGVAEAGQLGPALGAGGLDQGHVAADARVGAPDGGVDPVALDDVEQVARQPRLGEQVVEAGEVGLGRLAGGHGVTPG
jgi:hypothetical protein